MQRPFEQLDSAILQTLPTASPFVVFRALLELLRVDLQLLSGGFSCVYERVKLATPGLMRSRSRSETEICRAVDLACVFYFKDGFQRVTAHFDPVYPPYSEQPQIFFPGDRVLMVAQFEDKSPVNPQGRWTAILTRFLGEDTDRLFSQDLFFLDGGAADSLLYVNQSVPADSLFCRRILQPGTTTLAEVKTVLAEMAATPAKKTP